ncbi:hypothetical protein MKZ38_004397 [Zalerion maritima]|uniref:BTB domain-containing protein n=1 Tax=Zalerion maritima TaxID=339359 RepID=A0AAD5RM38_9PEZI|nr:hypothetical protein MKZ38_004397 [Zalerion maritima]
MRVVIHDNLNVRNFATSCTRPAVVDQSQGNGGNMLPAALPPPDPEKWMQEGECIQGTSPLLGDHADFHDYKIGCFTGRKLARADGQDKTEFTIHTGLLPPLSATLTALADRESRKSPDGYVALEEVDKDVFLRFMQFLYTGTYTSFQQDKKEEPSRQVAALHMTASTGAKHSDQTVQKTPMGLDPSPNPTLATTSTIHQGNSKDSSHSTTLLDGGSTSNHESLSKPVSRALKPAVIPRGLFGDSESQQPATSLFGTTGGVFGPHIKHQPHTSLFDSVEVSNTSFGSSPSLKRKFSQDSTGCDCGPSKKKRQCLSGFAQKYGGAIIDQSNVHCKPKIETMSFSFSGHARLWVFANKFDITALMDLASSRLAFEMAQLDVWPSAFISEFGSVVRYVYDHCPAG